MVSYVDLANRRFLVTGASSGIGRQTAIELAARGASVVISGRDNDRLQETFHALTPGDHLAVAGDLTVPGDIAALVDAAGPINGVVHSAGRSGLAPLKLLSEKFLDEVLAANFKSTVMLTQRLLAKGRIKDGGSIVIVISISAHTGTKGVGPYTASKGALLAFMRPVALELAAKKIRINGVSPALVRTAMFKPEEADWLNEQEKRYPLGLGKPEDVAYAAAFLLSDASRYMTGTSIIMDGGCEWI
jgi:NAD(P)-dependent dehydrogenase (short-subunit alcohol dehydrogenase family)